MYNYSKMIDYNIDFLKPAKLKDLIRIGCKNDGGYILNQRNIFNTKTLISLGIERNYSFDEHFLGLNPLVNLYQYDFSISLKKFESEYKIALHELFSLKSLYQLLKLNKEMINNYKTKKKFYKDFKEMISRKNVHFYEQGVSNYTENNFITLEDIFKSINNEISENSVFLKIDIELSEFRIFDDLLNNSIYINGFVVEFHDLDLMWERFIDIITKTKKNFVITHIHGNNYDRLIQGTTVPKVLEITFCKKDLINDNEVLKGERLVYPINGLDYPNDICKNDYELVFEH